MEALIEYGHALGRAHTGDLDGARKAIARMQQLRDATKEPKFDYFKSHLDLQMQAASAWVAAAEGKKERSNRDAAAGRGFRRHTRQASRFARSVRSDSRTTRQSAARNGTTERKHSENLRPRSKSIPGRFRGLYGAAQAAEQAATMKNASRYYTKLAAQTSKAGGSRDELNHVREFLSAQAKAADSKGVANARE